VTLDEKMKKKLDPQISLLELLDAKGMSLLEVIIGSALVIGIGYGGVSLTQKFSQTEKTIVRSSDSERITNGARELFSNLDICAANLNNSGKMTSFSKELESIGIYKNGTLKSTFIAVDSKVVNNVMEIKKIGLSSIKITVENEPGESFPPAVELYLSPDCGKLPANSIKKDICLMQRTEAASLNFKYASTQTGLFIGIAEITLEFVKCADGKGQCSLDKVIRTEKKFALDVQANRTPNDLSQIVCLSPDSEMLVEANYNFCKSVNGEFIGDKCFSQLYNPCSGDSGSNYDSCASTNNGADIQPTGFAKVNTVFCDIGSRVFAKTNKFLTEYCQYKGLALGTGDLTESQNVSLTKNGCTLPIGETNPNKTYSYVENTLMPFFEKSNKNSNCSPLSGTFQQPGYPTSNLLDCCQGKMVYHSCKWDEKKQDFIWEKVLTKERLQELISLYNKNVETTNTENPPPASQVSSIPLWIEEDDYPEQLDRDPNVLYLTTIDPITGISVTIGSEVFKSLSGFVPKYITDAQLDLVKETYKANYCTDTKDISKNDFDKINPSVEK
jgi:hypothetical protein